MLGSVDAGHPSVMKAGSDGNSVKLEELPYLDSASSLPLHAQLSEILTDRISNGRGALVGKMLPSEEEISAYFGVSRPTVRQAMSTLQNSGLVTRSRGKGTSVAPLRTERNIGRAFDVLPANQRVTFKLVERSLTNPPQRVAQALHLKPSARVERIKRFRYHDDEVIGFEERYIPIALAGRISSEQLNKEPGIIFGKQLIRGKNGTISFTLRAILANVTLARILKIKKGDPVLCSEHTYFDPDEKPVLFGTVMFRGDAYDFSFQAPINGA